MQTEDLLFYGFFAGVIAMANLHGILLSGIFLFNKRLRSKANRYLALSILGICIILTYEAAAWLTIEDLIPLWIQYLPIYLRTAIPVGLFYFVVYFIDSKHKLSLFEKIGFYFLGLDIIIALSFIPLNLLVVDIAIVDRYEVYIENTGSLLSIVASIILLPSALQKVNQYQQFLYENYSTDHKRNLKWLRHFLVGVISCVVLWIVSFTQYSLDYEYGAMLTFTILTIGLVIILFWIGYFLILQNNWFELVQVGKKQPTNENKLSTKADAYYQQLLVLMTDDKLYEHVDLTLDQLAETLSISSGYLSQIIKEKEGKNLFGFVNYYRVEAVKDKLADEGYKNLTLMGIAMESGFNSKSTFHSVFKKFTGQTPSSFKKEKLSARST